MRLSAYLCIEERVVRPSLFCRRSYVILFFTCLSIGLVVTALISVFIFSEGYNMYTILGIELIVVGVVILNLWGNVGH